MPDGHHKMIMLDGSSLPDQIAISVGGGELVAYTAPAPEEDWHNQDTVSVIPYGPDAVVLVVADGAGGLPAGKRASQTAIASLNDSLQVAESATMLLRTAILNGIESANEAVLALANGSATTMTVVTIEGRMARTYQVGDSEALIAGQRGVIREQTVAHSPTGFAVVAGFLDKKEALLHEERHLVSNFIGTTDMRIDIGAEIELQLRDTVLVASDGLTDNIHLDEITNMIRTGPLDETLNDIIALVKTRMNAVSGTQPSKPDDLSIVLFRKTSN